MLIFNSINKLRPYIKKVTCSWQFLGHYRVSSTHHRTTKGKQKCTKVRLAAQTRWKFMRSPKCCSGGLLLRGRDGRKGSEREGTGIANEKGREGRGGKKTIPPTFQSYFKHWLSESKYSCHFDIDQYILSL